MEMRLAENWWAIVLRGIAAVLFAAVALFWPPAAIAVLVILFGAYALADGVFNLIAAFRAPREGLRWGPFAFAGIIGVLIGLVTFFWPGLTALALVSLVAFWSVVTGVAQIVAAIRLRKVIEHEWLLALSGALSVAFGVLIFLWPVAGVVALAIWIGAFALVYGALLIGVGFRLRRWRKSHGDVGGGAPVPRHA